MLPRIRKEDVFFLKELIEAGKYREVVDRCHPLVEVPPYLGYTPIMDMDGKRS